VDGARRGARSFVLAALRALHLAPLLVAVPCSYYREDGRGKVSRVAFVGLMHVAGRSPVVVTAW
jgi:hypothetical protein